MQGWGQNERAHDEDSLVVSKPVGDPEGLYWLHMPPKSLFTSRLIFNQDNHMVVAI